MHPDKSLLKTHNLSVGYATGQPLFSALNLSLAKGELVCFMGPNGVGKSTLLKTLAGLQPALGGTVTIDSAVEQPEKKLSVVLTDRITATNMTVSELIAYGRYPYLDWSLKLTPDDKAAITDAVNRTRIHYLLDKQLSQISDGQLQLAMIARALVQQTPLLLLDEPTAHLDLNNRVEIMNLLRELAHETGKGILVATHELDLALQTADLIWLAGRNNNLLTGIPEDLVLNGAFDDIFQFKGFDLKTGKVFHKPWRNMAVTVRGNGHEARWTKNALERNGFIISDSRADILIEVMLANQQVTWVFGGNSFNSLDKLIWQLRQLNP
ncbi:MAG: ABC transporter ATP-binding protein [Cyclobacteriaceae bacterium]|nr:ABC transporter ATP-binding protein [Cyclobacteriaceae bacterium]